jgi:hypothetical protein
MYYCFLFGQSFVKFYLYSKAKKEAKKRAKKTGEKEEKFPWQK